MRWSKFRFRDAGGLAHFSARFSLVSFLAKLLLPAALRAFFCDSKNISWDINECDLEMMQFPE